MQTITPTRATLALLLLAGTGTAAGQAAPACAPNVPCQKVATFIATLTDFRTSTQGRGDRLASMTLSIQNISTQVLRLAYVQNSGIATEDRGNRYGLVTLRGIGEVTGRSFDPKFVLQPGESATARFEFMLRPTGGMIFGSIFDVELALREIDPITANQFELGREHVLQYRNLKDGMAIVAAGPPPAPPAAPGATAEAPATPPATVPDPCAEKPRCYNAGAFVAEVVTLTPSMGARHHTLTLNVKIKNLTNEPLILAYKSSTAGAIDELGNRYYWGRAGTYDGSVTGMGQASARSVDARFGLRPGETRNVQWNVTRFEAARKQLGTVWSFDAALVELEPLNNNQARMGREFAMTFTGLMPPGAAAQAAKGLLNGLIKKKP